MLLKLGIVLMTLALGFTGVVTLVAVYDEPMERAVAANKPEDRPSVDPLVRKYPSQVRGRDMVTLQTCTPIPTFEKLIIVRADRV